MSGEPSPQGPGARLSPEDEALYMELAADPRSDAASLQGFIRSRGFDLTDQDAAAFITARSRKGAKVGGEVSYVVTGPDGAQFEVQAPEGAKEAEVLSQVQGYANGDAAPRQPMTFLQDVSTTAQDFLDGVLPSAGKTMAGVGGAIGNTIAAGLGRTDWHPGQAYDEESGAAAQDQAQFGEEHPDLAGTAGWAGFGSSFLLPGATVVRSRNLAAHMVNGAVTGSGYGVLSGALNDTGDGRLANATNGLMVGGVLGGLAAPAAGKVGNTVSAVRRNIPGVNGVLTGLENIPRRIAGKPLVPASAAGHAQAERILNREMDGQTIDTGMGSGTVPATPENVQSEVLRRHSLGVPAMPGDVTERLRSTTAQALQGTGTMASRARGVLASRQAQAGPRVRQHITAELGPVVDPLAEAAAIHARASAASGPGYRAAYAQPVVVTPDMEAIMQTPAFRDALPQAVRNIRNAQRDPNALGFRLDDQGNIGGVDTLSTEGFDQVIRAMRDSGRAAADINPLTGRVTNTTNSVHINQRAQDLKGALSSQNEAYRDVTANYADEMALRDALERGGDVSKLSAPEIEAQRRAMPQHAQEAWTAGARTALADDAIQAGLRPSVNVAQAARKGMGLSGAGVLSGAGDNAKQQAIEAMAGRPGVLSRVDDRLEAEDQAFRTYAAASNPQASRRDLEAIAGNLGTAVDVTRKLALGRIPAALAAVVLKANPQGTAAFRRDVQDRMVGVLTATTPDAIREGLGALSSRATTDVAKSGALYRKAGRLANVGVLSAAAQSADPLPVDDDPAADWAPYSAAEDLRPLTYQRPR